MRIKIWSSENLRGRAKSEDPEKYRKIILERILGKYIWKVWNGFIWLRIETSGRLL
jgi:hypothetical protein